MTNDVQQTSVGDVGVVGGHQGFVHADEWLDEVIDGADAVVLFQRLFDADMRQRKQSMQHLETPCSPEITPDVTSHFSGAIEFVPQVSKDDSEGLSFGEGGPEVCVVSSLSFSCNGRGVHLIDDFRNLGLEIVVRSPQRQLEHEMLDFFEVEIARGQSSDDADVTRGVMRHIGVAVAIAAHPRSKPGNDNIAQQLCRPPRKSRLLLEGSVFQWQSFLADVLETSIEAPDKDGQRWKNHVNKGRQSSSHFVLEEKDVVFAKGEVGGGLGEWVWIDEFRQCARLVAPAS